MRATVWPLVFGVFDSLMGQLFIGTEPSSVAETLSARIRTAWTTFAATGDPGWPGFDPDQRLTQVFDTQPFVSAYLEERSRRLWQDHDFPPLPLLTSG